MVLVDVASLCADCHARRMAWEQLHRELGLDEIRERSCFRRGADLRRYHCAARDERGRFIQAA